ncbi:regulatory protein RecX [Candidatus Rickettsiella viridis]|uniref:Regulatory protein RecX n=1 Tax=Candidatus Rickettsiella viridis TaxID=676208 RepID=A0A2Z5USW8_9COXI|nr:regulatory protein RecX [Candidatus Rickettsiella viridis]BBB14569.1 regulatory protein RecX [Candidatus Rickettsiella viridis]
MIHEDGELSGNTAKNSSAKSIALNYLSRREYTQLTLQKKLLQKGISAEIIKTVLQQLIQEGLLNDIRFCEAFIANRIRQGYGPVRIIAELRQQGVNEDTIIAQLQQNESVWLDCIAKMLEKKFSSSPENLKEKHRQIHYLQYRGFRLDQIKKCIATNKI